MSKEKKVRKPKGKLGKLEKREAFAGWVFVTPWLLGVLAFLIYPLFQSFRYAWYNIRITPLGSNFTYVGIENFTQIWTTDINFPQGIVTYLWQTIVEVPIIVVFALMIAMMLNGKIRLKGLFRLVFFLPVIIVSGPVMNLLVSEGAATIPAMNTTIIISVLDSFLPSSVAQGVAEIFSNMVMILWYSGVQILIFLSALQKIDSGMYEAARIDGGSGWECFWKITLPTIKPMILLNAVYSVIFLSGNEQNSLINMIQENMFSGVRGRGYGYASAMAWMYSLIVTLVVLLFFLLLGNKKDVYDRQIKRRKRMLKKEARLEKKLERRGKRNAKRIEKRRAKGKFKTYSGENDY